MQMNENNTRLNRFLQASTNYWEEEDDSLRMNGVSKNIVRVNNLLMTKQEYKAALKIRKAFLAYSLRATIAARIMNRSKIIRGKEQLKDSIKQSLNMANYALCLDEEFKDVMAEEVSDG
jgi:hypothetical protein